MEHAEGVRERVQLHVRRGLCRLVLDAPFDPAWRQLPHAPPPLRTRWTPCRHLSYPAPAAEATDTATSSPSRSSSNPRPRRSRSRTRARSPREWARRVALAGIAVGALARLKHRRRYHRARTRTWAPRSACRATLLGLLGRVLLWPKRGRQHDPRIFLDFDGLTGPAVGEAESEPNYPAFVAAPSDRKSVV